MLPKILTSIFGSRNERLLKQYRRVVLQVNALESQFEALGDTELRAKTDEFTSAMRPANRWTPCCPRPSPWSAKAASAH